MTRRRTTDALTHTQRHALHLLRTRDYRTAQTWAHRTQQLADVLYLHDETARRLEDHGAVHVSDHGVVTLAPTYTSPEPRP